MIAIVVRIRLYWDCLEDRSSFLGANKELETKKDRRAHNREKKKKQLYTFRIGEAYS